MKTVTRPSGVRLDLPDHVEVADISTPQAPASAPTRRAPPGRIFDPIILEPETPSGPVDDPVLAAVLKQEMTLVDAVELKAGDRSEATRRSLPNTLEPPRITTEVATTESAAVLFEKNGVYSWGIRETRTSVRATRRGAEIVEAVDQLTFTIPPELAGVGETTADSRLPGLGFIVDHVRAYVLKFVAHVALGAGVAVFERNIRKGLVLMQYDDPAAWKPYDEYLLKGSWPRDRAPRILLFVHGTFSSTVGSFGALGASEWGRALLADASREYDVVLGYDHPTLGEDPFANASDLLSRLETIGLPRAARIDAVAFSRGALVLRSLSEHLLPTRPHISRIERAVFVGSTNAGTELARPQNWHRLIDLYTNIVVAGCAIVKLFGVTTLATTILEEAIKTLGGLVKALADQAVTEGDVAGLAAMDPTGDFVTQINEEQPGQPAPSDVLYHAVTSEFDVTLASRDDVKSMSAHLVQWIIDSGVDQLMREPNDLVVNTASMTAIDVKVGNYVKSTFAFGKNPHVYHTVYFTRPETVKMIRDAFDIRPTEVASVQPKLRRAGRASRSALAVNDAPRIDRRIMMADSDEPFGTVRQKILNSGAQWLIVQRADMPIKIRPEYQYAYTKDEVLGAGRDAPPNVELYQVLDTRPELELHEERRSEQSDAGVVRPVEGEGVTGKRTIEMTGGVPIGVHDTSMALPSAIELARSANSDAPTIAPGGAGKPPASRGGSRGGVAGYKPEEIFGGVPTTKTPPAGPPDLLVDCHIAASMPSEVLVTDIADIYVTLSLDDFQPRAGGIVGKTKGSIALGEDIDVMVQCKRNFASVDPDSALVVLSATKRKAPLVFQVKPLAEGDGEIWVVATQRARTIGTIVLEPRVVATLGAVQPRIATQITTHAPPKGEPDVPVLQIFENIIGDKQWELLYTLELPSGRYLKFRTPPIEGDRKAYVEQVYKEIETRWVKSGKAQAAFENELRGYGSSLLDKLVPTEVQVLLWEHKDSMRGIQVLSEEPFIPWELVYLHEPPSPTGVKRASAAQGKFFAELGLLRWLHNYDEPPTSILLRENKASYIIPDYAPPTWKLPAAQAERPFLEKTFGAKQEGATASDALAVLARTDDLDLFHFSGHGLVPDNPAEDAVMTMAGFIEGGNKYIAEYLSATTVRANPPMRGPLDRRPWVTLNACQLGRMTVQLQSVGGFAPSFLYLGAGVFVAALWSVLDQPARVFSEALYSAFFTQGKTLAESVIDARAAARKDAADTWLSYAVYGNPSARLRP